MDAAELVGTTGIVTTTIPVQGLGQVKVAARGGTETFGAYSRNRGIAVPTGTRVTVTDVFPPRTLVVAVADG